MTKEIQSVQKTYSAPSIRCHSCAGLIGDTLDEVEGVSTVSVDVKAKTVTVDYVDPAVETKVLALLAEEGFKVTAL